MKLGTVVLDSDDAETLADFYQKLLGWTMRFNNEWGIGLKSEPEGVCLFFQEDADYARPVWPTARGRQQQMVHVDFFVDDLEKEVNQAIACGAKVAETQYSERWSVMFDPAGHPFCIEQVSAR